VIESVVSGRAARGERWDFESYESRIEVARAGRLLLSDAVRLVRGEGRTVAARMGEFDLLSTVVLLGPRLAKGAAALLAELERTPAEAGAEILLAASPLDDGLHLRLAARDLEAGLARLRTLVNCVSDVLADDPFARRP
jgi:urease accessory protein